MCNGQSKRGCVRKQRPKIHIPCAVAKIENTGSLVLYCCRAFAHALWLESNNLIYDGYKVSPRTTRYYSILLVPYVDSHLRCKRRTNNSVVVLVASSNEEHWIQTSITHSRLVICSFFNLFIILAVTG